MQKRGQGYPKKPRSGRFWWLIGGVGALVVVIVLVVIRHEASTNATAPPSSSLGNFMRVARPADSSGHKVPIFFLSALYCPFCAAERWPLAMALGRFGTWTDLGRSHSTSGVDGFSSVPTYDFLHAHYHSRYVDFVHRDVADAQGHPLQSLSPAEKSIVNRFDPGGSIPFLIIDGAYAEQGSGYSPGLLVHKPFAQVQADLRTKASDARAIHQEANILTALICHVNGGRPTRVCNAPAIRTLEGRIQ